MFLNNYENGKVKTIVTLAMHKCSLLNLRIRRQVTVFLRAPPMYLVFLSVFLLLSLGQSQAHSVDSHLETLGLRLHVSHLPVQVVYTVRQNLKYRTETLKIVYTE